MGIPCRTNVPAGAASTGAGATPVAPVAAPAPTAAGSASQRTPIPHEVLDAEYDMVHQVGGRVY